MDTLFLVLSLNKRRGLSEESGLFKFYTVSLLLGNSTLIKYSSLLGVENVRRYWEIGVKIMEIKVAEINATLN